MENLQFVFVHSHGTSLPVSNTFSRTIPMVAFDAPNEFPVLTCIVIKQENQLQLTYSIPKEVCSPASVWDSVFGTTVQSRKHELWKHNCLELFVGTRNGLIYWEYNFSLDGHWNCFRFDDYRVGMKEEHSVLLNSFSGVEQSDYWQFDIKVDIPSELTGHPLVCPSAVWFKPGTMTQLYYAPTHAERPDFHRQIARIYPVK